MRTLVAVMLVVSSQKAPALFSALLSSTEQDVSSRVEFWGRGWKGGMCVRGDGEGGVGGWVGGWVGLKEPQPTPQPLLLPPHKNTHPHRQTQALTPL